VAIKEAFLLDLGWLFFAGWIAVILAASWLAFGKDLTGAHSINSQGMHSQSK